MRRHSRAINYDLNICAPYSRISKPAAAKHYGKKSTHVCMYIQPLDEPEKKRKLTQAENKKKPNVKTKHCLMSLRRAEEWHSLLMCDVKLEKNALWLWWKKNKRSSYWNSSSAYYWYQILSARLFRVIRILRSRDNRENRAGLAKSDYRLSRTIGEELLRDSLFKFFVVLVFFFIVSTCWNYDDGSFMQLWWNLHQFWCNFLVV